MDKNSYAIVTLLGEVMQEICTTYIVLYRYMFEIFCFWYSSATVSSCLVRQTEAPGLLVLVAELPAPENLAEEFGVSLEVMRGCQLGLKKEVGDWIWCQEGRNLLQGP